MKIKIEKIGINGEGIGYIDRIPTFVPSVLPQETAEIDIVKRYERYNVGEVKEIIEKSPRRISPPCPVQHRCGGCAMMHVDQKYQIELKEMLLKEALLKYSGKFDFDVIQPMVVNPVPTSYRNQCKLPVRMLDGKLVSGMYRPTSNHFVPVQRCLVHEEGLDKLRARVLDILTKYKYKEFDARTWMGIRFIVLRGFNGIYQCTLITGKDKISDECVAELSAIEEINSYYQSVNTDKHTHEIFGSGVTHLAKAKTLEVKMAGLVFRLSPMSFFQLNIVQAEKLYAKVVSLIQPSEFIVEAYCGVGAMTLMMSPKARDVVGIESIDSAVKNAGENAKLNKIDNVRFVVGDAAEELTHLSKGRTIDVLVVDPPRSGLDDPMIGAILKSKIQHLIYVSCNPSTLAKNLKILREYYKIVEITPFELFTHTPLVETVVSLKLKK
jgi:23S rRNA (uracil1939-C5)-methyltransferase